MDGSTLPNGDANAGGTLRRVVVITNPNGLHLRAAAKFAEAARRFGASVVVRNNGNNREVNGKSMVDLLLLNAPPGTELTLEVSGADAPEALPALADVLGAAAADDTPAG